MGPVMKARNASLLLIFGAVSPSIPYNCMGSSETTILFEQKYRFQDEPAHFTVPFVPGPNDNDVTTVLKAESVKQAGIRKLTHSGGVVAFWGDWDEAGLGRFANGVDGMMGTHSREEIVRSCVSVVDSALTHSSVVPCDDDDAAVAAVATAVVKMLSSSARSAAWGTILDQFSCGRKRFRVWATR